jgi:sugar phosphate isomerase/epimerase
MGNRRDFIKNSGMLALGGMMLSIPGNALNAFSKATIPAPGLQLYTLGFKLDEDLDGSLERIASIGYKHIESAFSRKGGYYGLTPKQFADKVKSFGMSWDSHHAIGAPFKPRTGADGKTIAMPPMKNLRENYQELVDDAAAGGLKYLVCPGTPIETMDEINKSIETFNKTGEACKKAGITFAFHNHTKEYEAVEGKLPYDLFLTQVPADLMKMELDLAWVTKAGVDPVELFRKNPGRYPLWHVKDLDKDQKPAEVGTGSVDFKRIFENAELAGLRNYFVEQDQAPSPFDNITTSITNLKKLTSQL